MNLTAPIGMDDFKKLIEQDYLYVDKTLMIEEVCETSAEVRLITRPRRFGKTINMSMLRYFFDCGQENSSHLFRGLAIEKRPCFYWKYHSIFIASGLFLCILGVA